MVTHRAAHSTPLALVALCSLGLGGPAEAQVLHRSTTAAELALAGATRTLVGDVGGVFYNPAVLAGAELRAAVALGFSLARTGYEQDETTSRDLASPEPTGYAALTLPLWRRVVLGVAYRRSVPASARHAPSADENDAFALRHLGRAARWREHEVSLGLAFTWRWLAVGAALALGHADLELERTLFAGDADEMAALGTRRYDVDLRGGLEGLTLRGRVGVTLAPTRWLTLALDVELPQLAHLEGEARFEGPKTLPANVSSLDTPDADAAADLGGPWRLGAGAGVYLTRALRCFVDVELLFGGEGAPFSMPDARWIVDGRDVALPSFTLLAPPSSSLAWRVGAELSLFGGHLLLRGGWASQGAAHTTSASSALLIDPARHELGVGAVLRASTIAVAFGLKHAFAARPRLAAGEIEVIAPRATSALEAAPAGSLSFTRTQAAIEISARY